MRAWLRDADPRLKAAVRDHWEREPCGSRDIPTQNREAFFSRLEEERYAWEPYIKQFADFPHAKGKRLLEIGVGAGSDFLNWVREGAIATGVDLTHTGIMLTRERLSLEGLEAKLSVADAEHLPFPNDAYDLVYSWGVLHHSPGTLQAISEVERVLRPGGKALVMIYHYPSWTGLMTWAINCAVKGKFWVSPRQAVYKYLESPGTKSYTVQECRALFAVFRYCSVRRQLSHGDLLLMRPSARYESRLFRVLWKLYPRRLVRLTGNRLGSCLLIEAWK